MQTSYKFTSFASVNINRYSEISTKRLLIRAVNDIKDIDSILKGLLNLQFDTRF